MYNLSEEEKKATIELNHFSNITAYWKKQEYTNSEINNYIKIVLNLIEKQQKEIEELKDNYIRLQNTEAFQDIYIKKDKIKEKIAEYDKKKKDIPHDIDFKAFYTIAEIRNIQIDVLKALLEEE